MDYRDRAITAFEEWYDSRTKYNDPFPAKGAMGGALYILERLKTEYVLNIDAYKTTGGTHIARFGKAAVKPILARFGESRVLVKEGRTNRGLVGDVEDLLKSLSKAELKDISEPDRNSILAELQGIVATRVTEFLNQGGFDFEYDSTKTTARLLETLLNLAHAQKKDGPMAQHLVGAKLVLRYPGLEIENHCSSTADDQLGRLGDFQVKDTVFHVSVSPNTGHWEKAETNLKKGLRVYVLVPERIVVGQKQIAEENSAGKIAVYSIEAFVGQNIDELSEFTRSGQSGYMRQLLEVYNQRVKEVETDKSILIEIPDNLQA